MHSKMYLARAILWIGFVAALSTFATSPQSLAQEKPRPRDFGSSLKRLRWDPKKNAAVETKHKEENGRGEDGEDVLRVETSLVVCDDLVFNQHGQQVRGLTRSDFVVTEDGQPQQIGTFALGDNAIVPRSIVLIIDYSGSQLPFLKTSIVAAKTLVDALNSRDKMAIVTDDVELLADFTQDKKKLKEKLESLENRTVPVYGPSNGMFGLRRRFGRSAQYSALMASLKELFDDKELRPIIIFQTDGDELVYLRQSVISLSMPPDLPPPIKETYEKSLRLAQQDQRDNMREFSLSDLYTAAEKSRATIYTIIPGFRLMGLSQDEQVERIRALYEKRFVGLSSELRTRGKNQLQRMPVELLRHEADMWLKEQTALTVLARITGGWTEFLEEPSQAPEVYARILSDMNSRYIIGYYPSNKAHDGKQRKINIEVRGHPEYAVLGRKSYYAPDPEQ